MTWTLMRRQGDAEDFQVNLLGRVSHPGKQVEKYSE